MKEHFHWQGSLIGWRSGAPLAVVFVCTMFASTLFLPTMVAPALADEAVSTDDGRIARGGRLYDKWFAVIGAEKPADTHSAWPDSNTNKSGNTTWRCKSCHGWDNLGKDGAYATGSYQTGIPGVRGLIGADEADIVAKINDDTHGLAGMMDDQDFADVALFISAGLTDMDAFIDRETKAPKGDAAKGQVYFETVCVSCHGSDGMKPKDMPALGGLTGKNPWEVLHKIRYGQPNEGMPALAAFDPQVATDIMAYLVTLPKE